jgi:hypothetical protein
MVHSSNSWSIKPDYRSTCHSMKTIACLTHSSADLSISSRDSFIPMYNLDDVDSVRNRIQSQQGCACSQGNLAVCHNKGVAYQRHNHNLAGVIVMFLHSSCKHM